MVYGFDHLIKKDVISLDNSWGDTGFGWWPVLIVGSKCIYKQKTEANQVENAHYCLEV